MENQNLTEKQQAWLNHTNAAKTQGISIAAYAKANNIKLNTLYNGIATLRQKGYLAESVSINPFATVVVENDIPSIDYFQLKFSNNVKVSVPFKTTNDLCQLLLAVKSL